MRSGPPVDRAIADLARRQHGVVAWRQLRGLGISEDRIKGRIRRGQLHGLHRGVYASRSSTGLDNRHSFPRPRLNADVAAGGRFFSADCLWLDRRLIVELDGRAVHGTDQAFEGDRERDRVLLAAGWRVTRVTWRQLRDDEAGVAADLRLLFEG